MPTTPKFGLPYPAAADPADVPLDLQKLASRVDTIGGLASGLATLAGDGKVPLTQLPSIAAAPAYGTSLPASPADGQEAVLVDSVTGANWVWRFRYNAGASSPYKWEFIGGSPSSAQNLDGVVDGTVAAIDSWTGVGPGVLVPRSGDYLLQGQTTLYRTINNAAADIFVGVSATGQAIARIPDGGAETVSVLMRVGALALGTTVRLSVKASTTGGLGTYDTSLSLTPIRVT